MSFGDRLGLGGLILTLFCFAASILWPDQKWIGWIAFGCGSIVLLAWLWIGIIGSLVKPQVSVLVDSQQKPFPRRKKLGFTIRLVVAALVITVLGIYGLSRTRTVKAVAAKPSTPLESATESRALPANPPHSLDTPTKKEHHASSEAVKTASLREPYGPPEEITPQVREAISPQLRRQGELLGMSVAELRRYSAKRIADLREFDAGWSDIHLAEVKHEPDPFDPTPKQMELYNEELKFRNERVSAIVARYQENFNRAFPDLDDLRSELLNRCKDGTTASSLGAFNFYSPDRLSFPGNSARAVADYFESMLRACL